MLTWPSSSPSSPGPPCATPAGPPRPPAPPPARRPPRRALPLSQIFFEVCSRARIVDFEAMTTTRRATSSASATPTSAATSRTSRSRKGRAPTSTCANATLAPAGGRAHRDPPTARGQLGDHALPRHQDRAPLPLRRRPRGPQRAVPDVLARAPAPRLSDLHPVEEEPRRHPDVHVHLRPLPRHRDALALLRQGDEARREEEPRQPPPPARPPPPHREDERHAAVGTQRCTESPPAPPAAAGQRRRAARRQSCSAAAAQERAGTAPSAHPTTRDHAPYFNRRI